MKQLLFILFACLFLAGCVTSDDVSDVGNASDYFFNEVDEQPSEVGFDNSKFETIASSSELTSAYNYILKKSDFSENMHLLGIDYSPIDIFIVSDVVYSILLKNHLKDGYSVYLGSYWEPIIFNYEESFFQKVYIFNSPVDALNVFFELNTTLYTGYYDASYGASRYEFNDTSSLRVMEVRRSSRNTTYFFVDYLYLSEDVVTQVSYIYPSSKYNADHYLDIVEKVQMRINSPETDSQAPHIERKHSRLTEYVVLNQTQNFSIYLNNISVRPVTDDIAVLDMLEFTIVNENVYPFYPVVAYYTYRDENKLQNKTRVDKSNIFLFDTSSKWINYMGLPLRKGDQMTFVFPKSTQIGINSDNTTRLRIQVSDQFNGYYYVDKNSGTAKELGDIYFDLNLTPFFRNSTT
jgi:hypothetical protein